MKKPEELFLDFPIPERTNFSIEIEKNLLEEIRKVSKEKKITLRQITEFGMREFLKRIEAEKKP